MILTNHPMNSALSRAGKNISYAELAIRDIFIERDALWIGVIRGCNRVLDEEFGELLGLVAGAGAAAARAWPAASFADALGARRPLQFLLPRVTNRQLRREHGQHRADCAGGDGNGQWPGFRPSGHNATHGRSP